MKEHIINVLAFGILSVGLLMLIGPVLFRLLRQCWNLFDLCETKTDLIASGSVFDSCCNNRNVHRESAAYQSSAAICSVQQFGNPVLLELNSIASALSPNPSPLLEVRADLVPSPLSLSVASAIGSDYDLPPSYENFQPPTYESLSM